MHEEIDLQNEYKYFKEKQHQDYQYQSKLFNLVIDETVQKKKVQKLSCRFDQHNKEKSKTLRKLKVS